MICPRCKTDNPVPEATNQRCHACGYSLVGEVSEHDVHVLAARRAAFRLLFFLVVLVGIIYVGIRTEWFGLRSAPFTPSESIQSVGLFGADPIDFETPQGIVTLQPQSNFSVSAVVLLNQRYADGNLAQVAPRDLVVAWGDLARGDRKRISVVPHDRAATLSSPDGQFTSTAITSLSAVLHVIPANQAIKAILDNVSGGARVSLEGLVVRTTVGGEVLRGLVPGEEDGEPTTFLLYVTGVTVGGKAAGLQVAE